jgi:hypothetical protein
MQYTTANINRADTIARAFVHASPCDCVCKASRHGPAAEDLEMRLLHVCMPAYVYACMHSCVGACVRECVSACVGS